MSEQLRFEVPSTVLDIVPYKAGKTLEQTCADLGVTNPVKLSSNENPLGTGKLALAALADPGNYSPSQYPDASAVTLRAAISKYLGMDPGSITCGNGSNEILEMAATLALRPGRKAVFSEYGFIVYKLATLARGATPVIVPAKQLGHNLDAMKEACEDESVGVVFVANPNNPTGTWHSAEAIQDFVAKVPANVLVVLDEAYLEYAENGPGDSLAMLDMHPNLLISRTFSKLHGLAGLRIGYGIAGKELTDLLNRVRQPFNANSAAQAAASQALSDEEFIQLSQDMNENGMLQLQQGLANLGYPTIPSQANFISFNARSTDETFNTLLKAGLVVRQLAEYGLESWLRTTVGTAEHNERLLQALPKQ